MPGPGYAVFDLETTGLTPLHHRVIEIGVVLVSPDGEITDRWETLLHPDRDLGPTHVHGLRGAHMRQAPRFAEIADELAELLHGRVPVAHNASFDTRFLAAEWARAGILPNAEFPSRYLCTMQLAARLMPGIGRKLSECCASLDIELVDAHAALADAEATAQLLSAYIDANRDKRLWGTALSMPFRADVLRRLGSSGSVWSRAQAEAQMGVTGGTMTVDVTGAAGAGGASTVAGGVDAVSSPLARVIADEPGEDETLTDGERAYFALLDICLEDGILTVVEADQLTALSETHGVSQLRRHELHQRYFDGVVASAWQDGVLTDAEATQLRTFGEILGIGASAIAAALEPRVAVVTPVATDSFALAPGMGVTMTGTFSCPKEQWAERLEACGFVWEPTLTKKRTDVLIAADVDSLSGKAKKARQYGKPIRDEAWLEAALAPFTPLALA